MFLALVAGKTLLRVGIRLRGDRMNSWIFDGEFELFGGSFWRIKNNFLLY